MAFVITFACFAVGMAVAVILLEFAFDAVVGLIDKWK